MELDNINGLVEYITKNGKGKIKEYNDYNGKLKFEVDYLKGEINGKGKEFDNNGKLVFEGEYLNGERKEKWKEFDDNDDKLYLIITR